MCCSTSPNIKWKNTGKAWKRKKEGLQRKNHECGTRYLYPNTVYRIRSIGQENEKYHKHLAHKIAAKSEDGYSKVAYYIRCKVTFIVLCSVLLCLRGSKKRKDSDCSWRHWLRSWRTSTVSVGDIRTIDINWKGKCISKT